MNNAIRKFSTCLLIAASLCAATSMPAQSGGIFQITESVVASGGSSYSGGIFEVESTTGQHAAAGGSSSGVFGVTSGFWNFTSLAPTAAGVSIAGRVLTPSGAGLVNATVLLHTQDGELRTARSSSFGYYRFEDIPAGQSVFISVQSKLYVYQPQVVMVHDDVAGVDFIPEP